MPVATNFADGKILFSANLNSAFANSISVLGDTMQGPLTLVGDPVSNLQPATKQYVDAVEAILVSIFTSNVSSLLMSLPTSLPAANGYMWINNGVLQVS